MGKKRDLLKILIFIAWTFFSMTSSFYSRNYLLGKNIVEIKKRILVVTTIDMLFGIFFPISAWIILKV